MSFQSSVNQAFNVLGQTAAISKALKQSDPEYQEQVKKEAQIAEATKRLQAAESATKSMDELVSQNAGDLTTDKAAKLATLKSMSDIIGEETAAKKHLFDVDPTAENLKNYLRTSSATNRFNEQAEEMRMKLANERAQSKAKLKEGQRKSLKNVETSLGGTIGDLPKSVQRAITEQLTEKDKRSLRK